MDKLEVGMYVRTKMGYIARCTYIDKELENIYGFDSAIRRSFGDEYDFIYCDEQKEYIIKASHNIIDLIEEGDYVNGNLIEMFYDCWNDEIKDYEDILGIAIYDDARMDCITSIRPLTTLDIKSIVTKEQFESIEYSLEG